MLNAMLLLAALAVPQSPAAAQGIPAKPEEFEKRYKLAKVFHENVGFVEMWVEDAKVYEGVKPAVEKAVKHAETLLGKKLLEGQKIRVIVVKKADAFDPILADFFEEAKEAGSAVPGAAYVTSAKEAGSSWWGKPSFVLVSSQVLVRDARETRIVHNLGHILGGMLVSVSGVGPPSLSEGLAGELVRVSVARPDAVVCGEGAALKDKMHGYGVFAATDVMNDNTNDVAEWPRLLKQVVRSMRKPTAVEGKADDEGTTKVQVAALLARKPDEFRRTDYAFAWSVLRFLIDPAGPAAAPANGAKKTESAPAARRDRVLAAFEAMRADYDAAPSREAKIDLYRDRILAALEMTPQEIHTAWLNWADKAYAK